MTTTRILVADDEAEIRNLLAKYLEREGWIVDTASSGRQALSLASAKEYDLVILDLMMPDIDGFEVCRQIRNASQIPVLIVSAKDDESDKVSGLMLGADDYITKPFSMNELIARVRAHLRRSRFKPSQTEQGRMVTDKTAEDDESTVFVKPGFGISVDIDRHTVTKKGTELALTPKEFDLLVFLMRNPGQVFTKSRIFRSVWGESNVEDDNTVMVHIRRLRQRVETNPSAPVIIKTVHGIGYCFADEKKQ